MRRELQLVVVVLLPLLAIAPVVDGAEVRPLVRERPSPAVATRFDSLGRNRQRRPVEPDHRDQGVSRVIKHPNGTLTYVFPENLPYRHDWQDAQMDSGELYFPGQLVPRKTPQIPAGGRDTNIGCGPDFSICTNVINYPQQLVNEIMARHEHRFAEVFGNDVVVDSGDQLDKRFDTSDDESLCASREKLIHPQSGYTMDKRLVTIVNTPNYAQGVRIETCVAGGRPCDKLDHVLSFYRTECKQLYHYRTLLAIDPITNQPYKESFRVPSCCKCFVMALRHRSGYGN